jgi:hypothetical protein
MGQKRPISVACERWAPRLLTIAAGMANIQLPSDLLTQLVDGLVQLVQALLLVISTITTIVGILRTHSRESRWHAFDNRRKWHGRRHHA